MKQTNRVMLLGLSFFATSFSWAQNSMELEEACFMDVDLTNYIVEVIEKGSSDAENLMTTEESDQILALLDGDEASELSSAPDKLEFVLTACSEGKILQTKHSSIINPQ